MTIHHGVGLSAKSIIMVDEAWALMGEATSASLDAFKRKPPEELMEPPNTPACRWCLPSPMGGRLCALGTECERLLPTPGQLQAWRTRLPASEKWAVQSLRRTYDQAFFLLTDPVTGLKLAMAFTKTSWHAYACTVQISLPTACCGEAEVEEYSYFRIQQPACSRCGQRVPTHGWFAVSQYDTDREEAWPRRRSLMESWLSSRGNPLLAVLDVEQATHDLLETLRFYLELPAADPFEAIEQLRPMLSKMGDYSTPAIPPPPRRERDFSGAPRTGPVARKHSR